MVIARSLLGLDFAAAMPPVHELSAAGTDPGPTTIDLKEATREFQRSLIERALAKHGGNWAATARSLNMHRSNFHHLVVRLGLKKPADKA